mgnify:CR=1 FL=1
MEMLKLTNIVKSFGTNEVLRGVSLAVERGEIIAVIGPSGSGKSTMLRSCVGLERISDGCVWYWINARQPNAPMRCWIK